MTNLTLRSCKQIKKLLVDANIGFPVHIAVIPSSTNKVGAGEVLIGKTTDSFPSNVSSVFHLKRIEGVFCELYEYLSFQPLYTQAVLLDQKTHTLDELHALFKGQGLTVVESLKKIDTIQQDYTASVRICC